MGFISSREITLAWGSAMSSHLSLFSSSSFAKTLIFPFTPLAEIFGIRPLSIIFLFVLGARLLPPIFWQPK
jgi:hypothetical protein